MNHWLNRQRDLEHETQIMWALVTVIEQAVTQTADELAVREELTTALTSLRQKSPNPVLWAEALAASLVRLVAGLRQAEAVGAELAEVQAERGRLRHDVELWLADPLQEQVRALKSEREIISRQARQLAERVRDLEANQGATQRAHAATVAQLQADIADLQAIVARQQLLLSGTRQPESTSTERGGQQAAKRQPQNAED